MAKLPNIRKLRREDVKDAPDWIDRLIQPLNQFLELVYSALNRNLTFYDNIQCQLKELTFTTSADYVSTSDFKPLFFAKTITPKFIGLLILQIVENNSTGVHTPITTGVTLDWLDLGNGNIRIYFISGLKDSTEYTIRVIGF